MTRQLLAHGESFEFCIEWTGVATIAQVIFFAEDRTEASPGSCVVPEEPAKLLVDPETGSLLDEFEAYNGEVV